MTFAKGNAKLILSQEDVALAIEYFLNEKVLKSKCKVTGLNDIVKANQWYEFEVSLEEEGEERNESDKA